MHRSSLKISGWKTTSAFHKPSSGRQMRSIKWFWLLTNPTWPANPAMFLSVRWNKAVWQKGSKGVDQMSQLMSTIGVYSVQIWSLSPIVCNTMPQCTQKIQVGKYLNYAYGTNKWHKYCIWYSWDHRLWQPKIALKKATSNKPVLLYTLTSLKTLTRNVSLVRLTYSYGKSNSSKLKIKRFV